MEMSAARPGAAAGSVRSASRAISVSSMMFFFSTVTSSVSACAKATTTCGWPAAMARLQRRRAQRRSEAVACCGAAWLVFAARVTPWQLRSNRWVGKPAQGSNGRFARL